MPMLESSKTIGHISGTDLGEMHFICDAMDENELLQTVVLGEMLVVTDALTKERFLLRVTNVRYGQNPNWTRENARSHNLISNEDLSDEYSDFTNRFKQSQKNQLFLEAVCELIGYINHKGKFSSPKRLPSYFSPVRRLDNSDLDFMEEFLGDVPFGKLRSGSEVLSMDVGLFGELIAKHIGVFAQTGGGKSNTMQRLIGGVMETEGSYGMLLFEPHGEYVQSLKTHPYAKDQMVMFTQYGGSGARKLKISYTDLTVTDLMNIRKQMHWSEPQERFLREAEERLEKDWFRFIVETPVDEDDALTSGVMPVTTLKEEFRNTFLDTIRVCKSKLGRLKNAPYLVRDPKVSDVDEIMSLLDAGKIVLIDMASLQSTEELLLSTILASKTLKRRKKLYIKNRELFDTLPPVSVVLEEAQRVLSKDGNNDGNVFAQICNEGRKFKTGLMAITQQPKIMDPVLLSQFNTLFILSLSDEKDFDILSGISKKPIDKLRTEIKSLEPGEAIITSPKSPFAIPAKVELYEDYVKRLKVTKSSKPTKDSFKGMI